MIYFIRHGQTDLNLDNRLQGRCDASLNLQGIMQAQALNNKLRDVKFDYVFSSPQKRAIQTASIVSNQFPIIDERLNVYNAGTAEGLRKDEVKYAFAGIVPDPNVYDGVEDPHEFIKRIYSFLEEIKKIRQ